MNASGMSPRGLCDIPTSLLEQVSAAIEKGRLECPFGESDLAEMGLGVVARVIVAAIGDLERGAALRALRLIVAERTHRPPPRLDLVWSGPEARGTTSRDTALVLKRLFESAQRSVLIAGYAFDEPAMLAPLHRAMKERGVETTLFVNIESHATNAADGVALATKTIDTFLHAMWPFGPPRPRIYYDPRTAMRGPPWVSLHAKCVVVDEARTLVTSANFTERGHERNIEVGFLIEDAAAAADLVAQWRLLIAAGAVRGYGG